MSVVDSLGDKPNRAIGQAKIRPAWVQAAERHDIGPETWRLWLRKVVDGTMTTAVIPIGVICGTMLVLFRHVLTNHESITATILDVFDPKGFLVIIAIKDPIAPSRIVAIGASLMNARSTTHAVVTHDPLVTGQIDFHSRPLVLIGGGRAGVWVGRTGKYAHPGSHQGLGRG